MDYKMNIAGVDCSLPLCPLNDELYIGAFVMFGQCELTVSCAKELLKKVPEYDYIITAEAKGIPLAYEMAKQAVDDAYIVARKKKKLYMNGVFEVNVQSITTEGGQYLYLGGDEAKLIKGKRILVVDDVISTGASVKAVEHLVEQAGGTVAGRVCVLAEGDAAKRDDIIFINELPLFDKDGNAI